MTAKEFNSLPWRFQSHVAYVCEHCTVYRAEVGGMTILRCDHVLIPPHDRNAAGRKVRPFKHYSLNCRTYYNKSALLAQITRNLKRLTQTQTL